jgi:hypothetical protein
MAEVTETRALPAPFIQTLGKTFGEQLGRLAPQEIDTTKFQPTLATPGGVGGTGLGQQAQQAAATQAGLGALQFGTSGEVTGVGQGTGVGQYQQYLTGAEGLTGPGGGTGAGSISQYESPYTQSVIDATKAQMQQEFDRQTNMRNAQAVGAGAFGGARQGIEQAIAGQQYNQNLGAMTAGLQQQGFQQAQQARQQDYQNQLGLGQYQQGMEGQRIQGMAQLGQTDIGYRQAMADTLAKQQQLSAYEPYQRTGFMGEQLAGLMGGYPGGSRMQISPTASPMQQGISTGLGALAGYAGFKNLMGK